MGLVSIYKANDEFTALSVRDMLAGNSVPAMVRNTGIPILTGIDSIGMGYWGDVMVEEEHEERALELVAAFRGTLGELADAAVVDEEEGE